MKKVTIRDVAKEAGVSIATVSYVLNDRKDKKVSPEKRKKVFQVANLLNYSPNYYVKSLTVGGSNNIIVQTQSCSFSVLKNAELMFFIQILSDAFKSKNYNLIFMPTVDTLTFSHVDAVLCIDMDSKSFHVIANQNLAPVLAVNCLVGDEWLFYQIIPDFAKMKAAADKELGNQYTYAVLEPANSAVKEIILSTFDNVVFVNNASDLNSLPNNPVLLSNYSLFDIFNPPFFANTKTLKYDKHFDRLAEQTLTYIEHAINRTENLEHIIKV